MTQEVGAFDARNRFGTLLDWVEAGQEVLITRRGKAVARLVPAETGFDWVRARQAAASLRQTRRGVTFGGFQIRDLIDVGRR